MLYFNSLYLHGTFIVPKILVADKFTIKGYKVDVYIHIVFN